MTEAILSRSHCTYDPINVTLWKRKNYRDGNRTVMESSFFFLRGGKLKANKVMEGGTNGAGKSGLPLLLRLCWVCVKRPGVHTSTSMNKAILHSKREGPSSITCELCQDKFWGRFLVCVVKYALHKMYNCGHFSVYSSVVRSTFTFTVQPSPPSFLTLSSNAWEFLFLHILTKTSSFLLFWEKPS